MSNISIYAVIVCYYPNSNKVNKLIDKIIESVSMVLIFDNGGTEFSKIRKNEKIKYCSLGSNVGIAKAINTACSIALSEQAQFLITFDQDSLPTKCMIKTMVNEFFSSGFESRVIAAIGPRLIDNRGDNESSLKFHMLGSTKKNISNNQKALQVSHLVTSGCLVNLEVWRAGLKFNDSLFIDFVDNDWCWRALKKNYIILGSAKAAMYHEISDGIKRNKFCTLNTYSPLRRFYQSRNAVYLLIYEKLSFSQYLYVLKSICVCFGSALFSDENTYASIASFVHGFFNGILKKMGPHG